MLDVDSEYRIADLPGELPPDLIPEDFDATSLKGVAIDLLQHLDDHGLVEGAFWKDWLALTGDVRTTQGKHQIVRLWRSATTHKSLHDIKATTARVLRPCKDTSWVFVGITFTTEQKDGLRAQNSGSISIIPDGNGNWKIWMLTTILESFHDQRTPDTPPASVSNKDAVSPPGLDYSVVIVGAGQAGLSLAGRLRALNIKALVVEKGSSVGTAWTSKYDTVRQHTLRDYNNLPFDHTWNEDDEDLLLGQAVAQGFANYVDKYGLEVWLNSQVSSCIRNDVQDQWTLQIATKTPNSSHPPQTITTRHLALALGAGVSAPYLPATATSSSIFHGTSIHQSSYTNGKPYKSAHCLVIGTGTTAHDIASDLVTHSAASVTMLQRSPTPIYPIDWIVAGQRPFYNRKISTDVADRVSGQASPFKVACEIIRRNFEERGREEKYAALFDGLEEKGFRVMRTGDMLERILERYGGYYIDVGACERIVNGEIGVKSGVEVKEFTEDGVRFSDGTEWRGEVVVWATGYERDYRRQVAKVVGEEIASELGPFWGVDGNGDVRGTIQENRRGLWMLGGTAPQARWWSRFVALKMDADLRGWDIGLGGKQEMNGVGGAGEKGSTNGVANGHG